MARGARGARTRCAHAVQKGVPYRENVGAARTVSGILAIVLGTLGTVSGTLRSMSSALGIVLGALGTGPAIVGTISSHQHTKTSRRSLTLPPS